SICAVAPPLTANVIAAPQAATAKPKMLHQQQYQAKFNEFHARLFVSIFILLLYPTLPLICSIPPLSFRQSQLCEYCVYTSVPNVLKTCKKARNVIVVPETLLKNELLQELIKVMVILTHIKSQLETSSQRLQILCEEIKTTFETNKKIPKCFNELLFPFNNCNSSATEGLKKLTS
ncbi:Hypothetical predicted protein, partial [Drosophila guanche]